MRKSTALLAIAALCISAILIIALSNIDSNENDAESVVAWPQFASKQEQQKLEFQALQGSLDAADRITGVNALNTGDDALYWHLIAAENGSSSGAYNVSSFLSVPDPASNDPHHVFWRERSWFWMKRAADLGEVEAKAKTDEMVPVPENEVKHWVIGETTVSNFKRAAMLGSKEAAFRLYKYYKKQRQNKNAALFWARIAAQNGQTEAPCAVTSLMQNSKDKRDRIRAGFWQRACRRK